MAARARPERPTSCCTTAWAAWPDIAGCGASCAAAWARFRRPSPPRRAPRARRSARDAAVARVLVRGGRAYGVVLEAGEEIEARGGGFQPRSQADVSEAAGRARSAIRSSSPPSAISASKAQAAKSTWRSTACRNSRAYPGARRAAPPRHHAHLPDIDYVERAWDDAKYGRPSERPLLELTIPTMYDPSLAPAGQAHHGHLPAIRARTPCARAPGTTCASRSATAWSG